MSKLLTTTAFLAAAAFLWGCGGSPEPVAPARSSAHGPPKKRPATIEMESEIGGLNEERVAKAFKKASRDLERCFEVGVRRHEFIGGDTNFLIMIDRNGEVLHAYMKRSTLGDRATEKCMLNALKKHVWPRPVGGRTGIAEYSFGFDPPEDIRPAVELPASFAASVSENGDFRSAMSRCTKARRGRFLATVYVSTSGSVLTASVTPPDEHGEDAVDCLVDALLSESFASPGSWMGKVTFSL
jgi:hypothetical protein